MTPAQMERVHRMSAFVVCVLLPASAALSRDSSAPWSMFTESGLFRIHLVGVDTEGRQRFMSPNELAAAGTPSVASVLGGSDRWRHAPAAVVRRHLGDLGALACKVSSAPLESVRITLEERPSLHADVVRRQASVTCGR